MKARSFIGTGLALCFALLGAVLWSSAAAAQEKFTIDALAEKKVGQLPAGPLYWTIETFPSLAAAQAAEGATSLAAEHAGKAWLFTLAASGAVTSGGTKIAEIGPVPSVAAAQYLLRVNKAAGAPAAKTRVHTHPGSEAFFVLAGKLGQRTPHGIAYAEAGQAMNGHGPDTPMEVFSAGTDPLDQLVLFVVDASRPFSTPAKLD